MRCISCAAAVACVELAASDGASGRGDGSTEVASRRGGATTRLHVCLLVEDWEVDPVEGEVGVVLGVGRAGAAMAAVEMAEGGRVAGERVGEERVVAVSAHQVTFHLLLESQQSELTCTC